MNTRSQVSGSAKRLLLRIAIMTVTLAVVIPATATASAESYGNDTHGKSPAQVAAKADTEPTTTTTEAPAATKAPPNVDDGSSSTLRNHTPWPCDGRLDRIHASHHRPGRMNVTFFVNCNHTMDTLHTWAQLWESRFWGWDRIGDRGSQTGDNVTHATVHANARCRNNDVRATAGGSALRLGVNYEGNGLVPPRYAHNPCNL